MGEPRASGTMDLDGVGVKPTGVEELDCSTIPVRYHSRVLCQVTGYLSWSVCVQLFAALQMAVAISGVCPPGHGLSMKVVCEESPAYRQGIGSKCVDVRFGMRGGPIARATS